MRRAAALATVLAAGPAAAQTSGATLEQVQQRFRGMSEIHIAKCDHDGNGLYTRGEIACVRSLYLATVVDN